MPLITVIAPLFLYAPLAGNHIHFTPFRFAFLSMSSRLQQDLLHRRHASSSSPDRARKISTPPTSSPPTSPPATTPHPMTPYPEFYARITAEHGPTPSKTTWSNEITSEYKYMFYQAAFALWRERHERLHPPPRDPSPPPHHTAQQVKDAMRLSDFRAEPRCLINEYLSAQGFPLLIVGRHDDAEYCLIPAPHIIACSSFVFPPWDQLMVGPHILSVEKKPGFVIHLLGSLRKRDLHEADLPFRESGYCMALGIDGVTGRAGRVYAIKCQQGDCWLGHIAGGVEELGGGLGMSFETVFKEDKWGVRLCRVLKQLNPATGEEFLGGSSM